jgi:hypothetical protein
MIIHDGNFEELLTVDPAIHGRGRVPRDWAKQPLGSLQYAAPFDIPTFPRSEWDERIKEIDAKEATMLHLRKRLNMKSLDQNGTNYCWINAVTNCLRLAIAYQQGLTPDLSPASGGAIIKGYRNAGGWSGEAIDFIGEHGLCDTEHWPANAISRQYDNAESQANRKLYRARNWWDLSPTFDQVATCLLLGRAVAAGLNWWSHEVTFMRLKILSQSTININYSAAKVLCARFAWRGEQRDKYLELAASRYGVDFWNSWSDSYGEQGIGELTESRATPGDAIAIDVAQPLLSTAA